MRELTERWEMELNSNEGDIRVAFYEYKAPPTR
jgi:hypothetical protein